MVMRVCVRVMVLLVVVVAVAVVHQRRLVMTAAAVIGRVWVDVVVRLARQLANAHQLTFQVNAALATALPP